MTSRRATTAPRQTRSGLATRREQEPSSSHTASQADAGVDPAAPRGEEEEEEEALQREIEEVLEEERQLREAAERREQLAQGRADLRLAKERVARLREAVEAESTLSEETGRTPTPLMTGGLNQADAATSTATRKTLVHPDKYKGRSLREFKIFTYKCEVNFRRDPIQFATDELQTLYAISLCEGEPLDRWSEHETTLPHIPTWKEFKTFLETLIAHPENRRLDMERKWREASQKPNQTVKEFVSYLESIAPYIDGLTDERKATHLLLGLKKPIANVILTQPAPVHGYEALQRMAERIEMTQRGYAGESRNDHHATTAIPTPKTSIHPSHRRSANPNTLPLGQRPKYSGRWNHPRETPDDRRKRHRSTPEREDRPQREYRRDFSQVECYQCHRKGHFADRCPDRAPQSKNGRP
jgi:hypothetical protein